MIRQKALPDDIEARLDTLPAVLAQDPDIAFVYLFGSLAEGGHAPLRDVDIAVYVREGEEPDVCRARLLTAVTQCLGTEEVELVVLNDAPISLLGRILQSRRVLLDTASSLRHRFESRTTILAVL